MTTTFTKTSRISLILTLLVVLGIGILAYMRFHSYRQQTAWVIHTYQVIETSEKMFSFLKDIQIGQRGYLLSGNDYFLATYQQGIDSLPIQLKQLTLLTSDNTTQQARIFWLQSAINRILSEITASIINKKAEKTIQVQEYLSSGQSKPKMDQIRQQVSSILTAERQLLAQRLQVQQKGSGYMEGMIYFIIGSFIIYTVSTFYKIRQQTIEKALADQELHHLNQELSATNEELAAANEEMAAANEEIVCMNEELTSTNEQLIVNSNALLSSNQELNQLKMELQDRVDDRTRVLEQTMNQLKDRNHELDNYVYKVSHDLRAPLASILGLLQLLDMELANRPLMIEQIVSYLEMIHNRVHKADQFVQSVLMHSKSLNLQIQPEPINFYTLISETYSELQYMKGASLIDLQVEIHQGATFQSDALFVGAILKNFLSNAIKYQDTGKEYPYVKFTIHISPLDAIIRIEDNGIGIEDQYQSQISNMFFRATSKSDGSGLGLYIVRQIVTRLGGVLKMESQWREGTIFTITLPNLQENIVIKEMAHV